MKYKVGDVLFVKKCQPKPPIGRPWVRSNLQDTVGIITEAHKHSDIFESDSTENDNGYIWFSQVDGQEYCFYEDEVDGEVLK